MHQVSPHLSNLVARSKYHPWTYPIKTGMLWPGPGNNTANLPMRYAIAVKATIWILFRRPALFRWPNPDKRIPDNRMQLSTIIKMHSHGKAITPQLVTMTYFVLIRVNLWAGNEFQVKRHLERKSLMRRRMTYRTNHTSKWDTPQGNSLANS